MSNSIYGIALSGLNASRSGLATVSHNIANVNTVGYNRQEVVQNARPSNSVGSEYIGQGVDVQTVQRVYSEFLTSQQEKANSDYAFYAAKADQIGRIDGTIADDASGLASALSDFFGAAQTLSTDPADMPARQNFLSTADSLAARFNSTSTAMDDLRNATDLKVTDAVQKLNDASTQIAELNRRILTSSSQALGDGKPNDLMDQRDQLVMKLSEQVQLTKVTLNDGSINLFMGNGQPLVVRDQTFPVTAQRDPSDPENLLVGVTRKINGEDRLITFDSKALGGGALAGYMSFRENELNTFQNKIGLMAAKLGETVNALQQSGVDLQGVKGLDLFKFGNPSNLPGDYARINPNAYNSKTNPVDLNLSTLNLNKVTGEDYEVLMASGGAGAKPQYRVAGSGADFKDVPVDGTGKFYIPDPAGNAVLTFGFSGALNASNVGDRFTVMPTRDAARNIGMNITRPELVAAASASDPSSGNNEVILGVANLRSQGMLYQNFSTRGVSITEAFNQMVSQVGNKTRELEVAKGARESVLNQVTETRDALSGVNLDEEAANLLKYQQAYSAAGRVISLSKDMFDQILTMFR